MTYTGTHMYVDLSTRNSFKIVQEKNDVFSNLEAMFSSIKTKTRQAKQPGSQRPQNRKYVAINVSTLERSQTNNCHHVLRFFVFSHLEQLCDDLTGLSVIVVVVASVAVVRRVLYNGSITIPNWKIATTVCRNDTRNGGWNCCVYVCVCVFNFQFCVLGLYALLCLLLGPYGRV